MFSVTDPLGRLVVLTEERERYILRKHPDIYPGWIEETIEEPDIIVLDERPRGGRRICYYKDGILPDAYGDDRLKVVIQLSASRRRGRVITSYNAHHIKKEERTVWTSPLN